MARSSKTLPMSFKTRGSHAKRVAKVLKNQKKATFQSIASFTMSIDAEKLISVMERQVILNSPAETAVGAVKDARENTFFSSRKLKIDKPTEAPYPGLKALKSDDIWCGDPRDMPEADLAFFGLEK